MASFTTLVGWLVAMPLFLGPPTPIPSPQAVATAPASIAALGAEKPEIVVRQTAQVRHIPEADVTLSGRPTGDGGFIVEARGGDLVFEKTLLPGGGFTLDLAAPNDAVVIRFTSEGVTVRRNGRSATVNLTGGDESELEAATQLLSGSRAIRLTRRAADGLLVAEDSSMAGASLLMADSLIGLLTGDEGAPGRIARHLARRGRGLIRRVQSVDCYGEWERRVLAASFEFDACYITTPAWNPVRNLCAYRWVLQVETYWFQMISCVGLNRF